MPPQVPEVKVTAQALLPSTSVISFTLGNGLSFTTFVNTVPINENRTINRFALIRCGHLVLVSCLQLPEDAED